MPDEQENWGRVILGDCIDAMREMPPASVDAVITDPPYGLEFMGKEWDRLSGKGRYQKADVWQDVHGYSPPSYVGGFAAQEWHTGWLSEAFRVLKPGGTLFAFAGTRTFHRLACAIEDVGFELRDTLLYLYGSGFPKCQDLGAMYDKDACRKELTAQLGRAPTSAEFKAAWNIFRTVVGMEKVDIGIQGGSMHAGRSSEVIERPITAPRTALACEWDGWKVGGLKPSHEEILYARKPLPIELEMGIMVRKILLYWSELCRNSNALNVVNSLPSSPPALGKALGIAVSNAEVLIETRRALTTQCGVEKAAPILPGKADALSGQMATLSSGLATPMSLSIGLLLAERLGGLLGAEKTLTISTATALITDLRILSLWLRALIQACTIGAKTQPNGGGLSASLAESISRSALAKLEFIGITSAAAPATSPERISLLVEAGLVSPEAVPSYEPILWARRPCEGSASANVLKYGVGAFNADAGRVGVEPINTHHFEGSHAFDTGCGGQDYQEYAGRFPSNLVLDSPDDADSAAAMLDEQSGENGASRFFPRFSYTSKATRWEREAGLKGMPLGGAPESGRSSPAAGRKSALGAPRMNTNPCVKPIRLMRWLIELITRENDTVLDPLAGSGSTGCAAVWCGREFIGIEKEAEYHAIAVARVKWWAKHRGKEYDAIQRQWNAASGDAPLFEEMK